MENELSPAVNSLLGLGCTARTSRHGTSRNLARSTTTSRPKKETAHVPTLMSRTPSVPSHLIMYDIPDS
jgi:hypothetical protein